MYSEAHNSYDITNHVLSFFTDTKMRRRAAEEVLKNNPGRVLDIATGTGDTALFVAQMNKKTNVIAMDANTLMLSTAEEKACRMGIENAHFEKGDAMKLKYPSNTFDAVICTFATKNMPSLDKFASESYRVLRKNGKLVIADISAPDAAFNMFMFNMYMLYMRAIGSLTGKKLYKWLPGSTSAFDKKKLMRILEKNSFRNMHIKEFLFGIAYIITYTK